MIDIDSPVKKNRIVLIPGVIISLIIIFISVKLATSRTQLRSRASGSDYILSLESSYVFASPVQANADGKSIVRITVFLLNTQGLGIVGKQVQLHTADNINKTDIQSLTDDFGRATFDLRSSFAGHYTISAETEGQVLSQKVSIVFQ